MPITWDSTVSTTPAGENKRLTHQETRRGSLETKEQPPVYGQIIEQRLAINKLGFKTLQVRLHIRGRDSKIKRGVETRWYGLAYPVDYIAHVFGNDLVGRRCMLRYRTIDPNSGVVHIIHDDGFKSDLDAAEALPPISTILGPPGSGL
jgi:hypothetical protein